jgi:hypothetical protein
VDKTTSGGGDTFNFRVDCTSPYQEVKCGDTVPGNTTTSRNLLQNYSCATSTLDGNEAFYYLDMRIRDNLTVSLNTLDPNLWVVIYTKASFESGGNCLAAGRGGAGVLPAPIDEYVIVVDGEAGASAAYTMDVRCGHQLECTGAAKVSCSQRVAGNTAGKPNKVAIYKCWGEALTGGEDIYTFTNPIEQSFSAQFLTRQPGQRLLVLQSCNESDCLLGGVSGASCALFPAGDYFIVVDGTDSGPYQFAVTCSRIAAGVDLQVSKIDASGLAGDCQNFDVSGTAHVDVSNLAQGIARAPFDVIVFEDRNVSRDYEPAADNLLGRTTVGADMPGGQTITVDVPSSGTLLFRDNVIWA